MKRYTQEQKSEILASWQHSNLSKVQFCEKRNLSAGNLRSFPLNFSLYIVQTIRYQYVILRCSSSKKSRTLLKLNHYGLKVHRLKGQPERLTRYSSNITDEPQCHPSYQSVHHDVLYTRLSFRP
jgi:hypothetical protein